MRLILCIILLVSALMCAGCTTNTPVTPNLVGNWTGPMKGYIEGIGYTQYSSGVMTMVVSEQKDAFFSGTLVQLSENGTADVEEFSGVINRDGKTFTMVEFNNGFDLGTIRSNNEIELVYVDDNEPANIFVDTFQRVP
jgi:hypothetical protein